MASTAFPEKGALALLDDLIAEMQANINSVGISNQLPQPPANASLTSDSIAPVAPENMEGGNDDKKKYEKKKGSGRPVKVEPNPPPKDVETVNALDFRVGVIRSVKKHETADKLYCEEIDIGEAEPRQIASGLVPHYTLEQMMGRRLIVVANLKPRKLQGFTSAGMVLCAATPDSSHPSGEKVEFIDPPNGSVPGDRVVGEGLMLYDALSPGQVEKQKTWEKIGSQLRVDSNGVATWNGIRLVVQSQADLGASSTRISHPPKAVITRSPYLNSDKGLVDIVGAFLDTLQNDRPDFLYPTVVCDPRGVCLGMVYSSAESIRVAFIERQGIYWSRSNAALWIKGLNSGQTQELVNISADCDSDTLRFTVFPCHDGYFCHRRTHSCWGDLPVGLSQLEASIVHRQNTQAESYTHQLLQNRTLLNQKLMEHAEELVEAKTKGDIAEEAYKTLYFLLTRCAADGVTLADIERHISARAQHVVRETPVLLESRVHHQNYSMFPATPIVRSKSAK